MTSREQQKAKARSAKTKQSDAKNGKDSKAEVETATKNAEASVKKRKSDPEKPKTDKDKTDKKKPSKTANGAEEIDEKVKVKPQKKTKKTAVDEKPQSRTWAGRWIPSDPAALARFDAIRSVFTDFISRKVKAPSSLQNPFFTLCNTVFASLSPNAEKKEFVACAKLQVEKFLASEKVRI